MKITALDWSKRFKDKPETIIKTDIVCFTLDNRNEFYVTDFGDCLEIRVRDNSLNVFPQCSNAIRVYERKEENP